MAFLAGLGQGQGAVPSCVPPFCVNRVDDNAANPVPGMLRYGLRNAPNGTVITFDPALNGRNISLDTNAPDNHIKIGTDVMIQGPGSNLLTIHGGNATRIFLITGRNVQISGLTLANGLGKGSDGGIGAGGGGGGGGAAGMGGAIFVDGGSLVLNGVELRANRAVGGNGGKGGSGFGAGNGGTGGECRGLARSPSPRDGSLGSGGAGEVAAGGESGWGFGGAGGAFNVEDGAGKGDSGTAGGFGGGAGGAGASMDLEGNSSTAGGGGGGAGFGGAIFVRSGFLQLFNTSFVGNSSAGGVGGLGAANGQSKGGALFVCTSYFCGPGHDGAAIASGEISFRESIAADASVDQTCTGKDDANVCGPLGTSIPTHLLAIAPPSVTTGAPFNLTIKALDANNNLVFTHGGAVRVASSDTKSALPADAALVDGKAAFPVILRTVGAQTITVTGPAVVSISPTTIRIVVEAGEGPAEPDSDRTPDTGLRVEAPGR